MYIHLTDDYYKDEKGVIKRKQPKIRGISKKRRKQITKMAKETYLQGQRRKE